MTPGALASASDQVDVVADYRAAMQAVGRKTGRSTMQAAWTFCAKVERAGGWEQMSRARQLDAIRKARSFASWLMVTRRLVDADIFGRVDLWLGVAARSYRPEAYAWFAGVCAALGVGRSDVTLQWNALAKVTAITGVPDQVGDEEFTCASGAILGAYASRGRPESGRNMASILHRLRLTLFHAGRLADHRRPPRHQPVSITGWAAVAPGFAEAARRYVEQVALTLRPATVKHIEHHLRRFGTWLAEHQPDVASCADLERHHIEAFKSWLAGRPSRRTGKPLRKLRTEMHRRMLGNGYCARPVEMGCHFESICESCTFFVTTVDFRPTLQRQRSPRRRALLSSNRPAPNPLGVHGGATGNLLVPGTIGSPAGHLKRLYYPQRRVTSPRDPASIWVLR